VASIGTRDENHQHFWQVAEPYLASGVLVEGTMMGRQCLRAASNGGFVATVERSSGNLVVKLAKSRVAALIESGEGLAFAPARRVFSEWVAVATWDERRWSELIEESLEFVGG
jgi:hypothetical protein